MEFWGILCLLNPTKLRIRIIFFDSQTLGDKIQSQKGNSPNYKLRSDNKL